MVGLVLLVVQLAILGALALVLAVVCSVNHCVRTEPAGPGQAHVISQVSEGTASRECEARTDWTDAGCGGEGPQARTLTRPALAVQRTGDQAVINSRVWARAGSGPWTITGSMNRVPVNRQEVSAAHADDPAQQQVARARFTAGSASGESVSRSGPSWSTADRAMRAKFAVSRFAVNPQPKDPGQTDDLPTVINNATNWLRSISVGLAILLLTYAGLQWLFAREPSGVERAKSSFGAACAGFALALLAPQIVSVLQDILGVG
ncbi:hypothetical protein Kisp01_70630 [Kineosporia sp. NBRC 101677]|uniref:pilin n=1 Tax=Kineosporia sp. NBRC 101677 TaxID=3032197 RepID=UPI0024A4FCB6|nr:pilin [Kineosporia sp. NBRC 101677]GLY20049.1 hypothetical protein Kisp01_70630 [Kineosporia sp. NBRC 101677]